MFSTVRVTFVTVGSYYKRLDNSTGLNYQDWERKCLGQLNFIYSNKAILGYYLSMVTKFTDYSFTLISR